MNKPRTLDAGKFLSSSDDVADAIGSASSARSAGQNLPGHFKKALVELPLYQIKPRKGTPTRLPELHHVLKLATNIVELGLIQPLAVNDEYHLLAGGNRLAALQILAQAPERREEWILREVVEKRLECIPVGDVETLARGAANAEVLPLTQFPVRCSILSPIAEGFDDWELAVEVAENEQRRDYSKEEILALKDRLVELGYEFGVVGRPTAEASQIPREKRLGVARLAFAFGKSERVIRRAIALPKEPKGTREGDAEAKIVRALKAFLSSPEISKEYQEWAENGLKLLEGS